MATPTDRVQALKQESTSGGGDALDQSTFHAWDAINETEDALSSAGLFIQKVGGPADENVLVWREGSDMVFKDPSNASGLTLTQLLGNIGGDTDFLLENEPPEPTNNYDLVKSSGRVIQERWRRASDSSLIKTIDYTYSSGKVSTEVRKVYATNGVTIVGQTTRTWSYPSGSPQYALTRNV